MIPTKGNARRAPGAGETGLQGSLDSTTLAAEINAEHQAAFGLAREALGHARRAGELLLQVKAEVGHGAWLPWIEANCKFSARTAQGYIRLAQRWETLQAKYATAADLTLRDALDCLSEKSATAATGVLPEEQRLLDRVRAAGGCSSINELNRVSSIKNATVPVRRRRIPC